MFDIECPSSSDVNSTSVSLHQQTEMEESAAQFVSAVVLIIVTLLAFLQVFKFLRDGTYPRAQRALCVLFLMPVVIGWISWEHVYTKEKDLLLEKVLNLYKAAALFSFVYYMNSLIGWTVAEGKSFFTDESLVRILMKQGKAECYLKCIPASPLTTPEQCRAFIRKTNIGVVQMAVVLIFCELAGMGLLASDYCYWKVEKKGLLYKVVIIGAMALKFTSSGIALNYILNYSIFLSKIDEFRDLAILSKFVILKLALFLTEIQGIIIYGFSWLYVRYYSVDESPVTVTLYTNSLLLCSEMIICGILQFTVFPLSDFKHHPELNEKLIRHEQKLAHKNEV